MEKEQALSKTINSIRKYKRKFSLREMYHAAVFAPMAMSTLIKNKKRNILHQNFIKRIHLAITEVNGCAICSYGHAQMALKQGMENEEINSFLSGGGDFIQPEEAKGILFAQHFADSRTWPQKYAYDAIIKEYGKEKAAIILAASQMMMVGNMYGIPLSAFLSRLKGNPYPNSSLFYELSTIIMEFFLLPIAIIHGYIRKLIGLPNERFDKNKEEQINK